MRSLSVLRRLSQPAADTSEAVPAPSAARLASTPSTAPAPDLKEAIRSIARQAGAIGRGAAEVRGVIDDTGKNSERSAAAVASLAAQVGEVHRAQGVIGDVSNAGLAAVGRVREAVGHVGGEVGAVVTTLREVAGAAESITQIALQTRLVAFNALVEAKRAGDAGRGFGVVADAVKDLAAKVEDSSKEIMRTIGLLDRRIGTLAGELRFDADDLDADHTVAATTARAGGPGGTPRADGPGTSTGCDEARSGNRAGPASAAAAGSQGRLQQALVDVRQAVASILDAAGQSAGICEGLDAQVATIAGEIGGTTRALGAAMKHSETFLVVSEELIELVARCGIETEDTPFIHAVVEAAGRLGVLLDDALASGAITAADLFDADYRPIPNTSPAQYTTRFAGLADRLFPAVQEAVLGLSPKVVFCIAVDRNGYVATHNQAYCRPQRGDPVWDTANSRYRRIFDDRTGLASARNQRPFLLQTYRRDMGGGRFIVMKEASAPIRVGSRHWGGLRLAFKF